jgi:hypothetical protein
MHAKIKHFASSGIAVATTTCRGHLHHAEILGHISKNEIEKWPERYKIHIPDHPMAWAAAFH